MREHLGGKSYLSTRMIGLNTSWLPHRPATVELACVKSYQRTVACIGRRRRLQNLSLWESCSDAGISHYECEAGFRLCGLQEDCSAETKAQV